MRRKGEELTLITFGKHTYSSDSRYSLEFEEPNDWRLFIQNVKKKDEGPYECQISSHPPLVLVVYLSVVGRYISSTAILFGKLYYWLPLTYAYTFPPPLLFLLLNSS